MGSLVVLPDLYNKPKDHYDLMRYLKVISDTANTLPIIYHHYPQYTGVDSKNTQNCASAKPQRSPLFSRHDQIPERRDR